MLTNNWHNIEGALEILSSSLKPLLCRPGGKARHAHLVLRARPQDMHRLPA